MLEYIPYSKRNNIADPELAGLLDYLEREMGWDIDLKTDKMPESYAIFDLNSDFKIIVRTFEGIAPRIYLKIGTKPILDKVMAEIFFRTYKTLLPVIRDLYSK